MFNKSFNGSKRTYEIKVRTMDMVNTKKKEEEDTFLRPSLSFSPNFMERRTPLPIAKPNIIEVKKVMRVKEEPTAAKAFLPKNRPTIKVSAIL